MNYPQNALHPEIVRGTSVGQVARIDRLPASGSIPFNTNLPTDSTKTIARAIAGGDTTERRIKQFRASMDIPTLEQK